MKAITCPQCGSLIRKVWPQQQFSECEYCGAKVIVDEHRLYEPYDEDTERFRPLPNYVRPKTPTQPIFFAIALIGAFSFVLFVAAALIPTKSASVAPPIEPEPFKPIIFPQDIPTIEKSGDDEPTIIFDDQGIGKVIVPKRAHRRLRP